MSGIKIMPVAFLQELVNCCIQFYNRIGDVDTVEIAKLWVWKNDDIMSKYFVHTTPLGLVNVPQQTAVAGDFNATSKTYDTKILMTQEYFILTSNTELVYANGDTLKYLHYIGINTTYFSIY